MKPQLHPPSAPVGLANVLAGLLVASAGFWTVPDCIARLLPLLQLTQPAAIQAEDFTYTTDNGTITISGYIGPGGAVTIPDTITGLPVTSIGSLAFGGDPSLTSVTIGTSVPLPAPGLCREVLVRVIVPPASENAPCHRRLHFHFRLRHS